MEQVVCANTLIRNHPKKIISGSSDVIILSLIILKIN